MSRNLSIPDLSHVNAGFVGKICRRLRGESCTMEDVRKNSETISAYIEDREYIANTYVLRCFSVTMLIYTIAFILNVLGIFIIDKNIMMWGYFPSLLIYILVNLISKRISLSSEKAKYVILFSVMAVVTIMGMSITYHVVLVSLLPFLYATLYSSKRVMNFVYFWTVISTVIVVYGGYFYGLCDANMVLLTYGRLRDHVSNGQLVLTQVNSNPYLSLMLYYVIPRCLIYIAFVSVCNNIVNVVSESLEKAKLTAELQKAKEAAETASNAKSQFLARMSHEIRTPINAVLGMNEMILRESREPDVKKYAHDIQDSANTLLNIINEILDSSKIESGKMKIVSRNYEIGSLLNDLYNMINLKAKEKGLELVFDIDSGIPSEYFGDDKRIKQIVLNLLTNAVKYTEQGKVTLKVSHKTEGESAILHYSIQDTGIGIKEEDIGKLYEEFQRIDESRNRYVEGTGLGMNIARQLLKMMGSDLQIQSEYGKGSEFSFDLEQKIVSKEPLGDFRGRILRSVEENDYRMSYFAPAAKILVVDDNKMNLRVFRGLLKKTQIQVFEAESGKACLDMLKQQAFNLIFLDHMMPEMDGIETFHAIQENKLCEGVPVIMLTANAIVGEKEKYLNQGFDDFLTKPIIPEQLDRIIIEYLPGDLITVEDYINNTQPDVTEEVLPKQADVCTSAGMQSEEEAINFAEGIANTGSEELFYSLLGDFYLMIDMKIKKIERCISENRLKDYTIEVHALKSSTRLIGIRKLSDEFLQLELLGNAGNKALIEKETPAVLEKLRSYKQILEKYVEKAESDKQEMDIAAVVALLQDMVSAIDNFDMDKADAIMKHIDHYKFPENCHEELENLRVYVADVAMEDIMSTCKSIEAKLTGK